MKTTTEPRQSRPGSFVDEPITGARAQPPYIDEIADVDDLADIKGIGPRIHDVLHEAGITSFEKLAETSVKRLEQLLVAAELPFPVDPSTWPAQARLAADGRWRELVQLQQSIKVRARA